MIPKLDISSNYYLDFNSIVIRAVFLDTLAKRGNYSFFQRGSSFVEKLLQKMEDQNTFSLVNYYKSIL